MAAPGDNEFTASNLAKPTTIITQPTSTQNVFHFLTGRSEQTTHTIRMLKVLTSSATFSKAIHSDPAVKLRMHCFRLGQGLGLRKVSDRHRGHSLGTVGWWLLLRAPNRKASKHWIIWARDAALNDELGSRRSCGLLVVQ